MYLQLLTVIYSFAFKSFRLAANSLERSVGDSSHTVWKNRHICFYSVWSWQAVPTAHIIMNQLSLTAEGSVTNNRAETEPVGCCSESDPVWLAVDSSGRVKKSQNHRLIHDSLAQSHFNPYPSSLSTPTCPFGHLQLRFKILRTVPM